MPFFITLKGSFEKASKTFRVKYTLSFLKWSWKSKLLESLFFLITTSPFGMIGKICSIYYCDKRHAVCIAVLRSQIDRNSNVKTFLGVYSELPVHYRRFLPTQNKTEKIVFWDLTLLLCKTRSQICNFVHQHGRHITWLKTIYWQLLNQRKYRNLNPIANFYSFEISKELSVNKLTKLNLKDNLQWRIFSILVDSKKRYFRRQFRKLVCCEIEMVNTRCISRIIVSPVLDQY